MTLHDETLPVARQAVERLYGQCLLSLQANEHLMKAMVAAYRFSASLPRSVGDHGDRAGEIAQKTMGALVSDMMGSLLVPQGHQETREDRDGPQVILPVVNGMRQ